MLNRQNSLLQANSPKVYVPAADSKDRRNAKRNLTILTNRIRTGIAVGNTVPPPPPVASTSSPSQSLVDLQPLLATASEEANGKEASEAKAENVTVSENNVTIESTNDTGSAEYKLFNTVISI